MTHTPGPWRYTGEKVCEQQTDDVIAQPGRNFSIINPSQTLEANARLIAEAPAMLEALIGAEDALRLAADLLGGAGGIGSATLNSHVKGIRAIIDRIEGTE